MKKKKSPAKKLNNRTSNSKKIENGHRPQRRNPKRIRSNEKRNERTGNHGLDLAEGRRKCRGMVVGDEEGTR